MKAVGIIDFGPYTSNKMIIFECSIGMYTGDGSYG